MPDPNEQQQEQLQEAAEAPTEQAVVPAGLFDDVGNDEASLERLNQLRLAETEDERKKNRSIGRKIYEATLEPALRGTAGAVDAASDLVVGTGAAINKKLGIYKLLNEQGEQNFLAWYQHRKDADLNPLKFGDEFRDKHLGGPSDSVWEGLVEGASQFAVGFIGTGAVMSSVKIASKLPTASRLIKGADSFTDLWKSGAGGKAVVKAAFRDLMYESARGGVTDAVFFSGSEGRLADMMEEYEFLRNPIQQYLVSEEGDSEFEGRMKNMLEGLMIGGAIDGLILTVRSIRAARRGLAAARAGVPSEVLTNAEVMAEAAEQMARIESSQILDLEDIPDTLERAGVHIGDDGATVVVKLTDEEKLALSESAIPEDAEGLVEAGLKADEIPMDSNQLRDVDALADMQAAVKDPETGVFHLGQAHEEAYEAAARSRLGQDAPFEAVQKLKNELMESWPQEADGYVSRAKPDEWMTRQQGQALANKRAREGVVTMQFDDLEEANQMAAALELMHKARQAQRGLDPETQLTPELMEAFTTEASAIEVAWKKGDADAIRQAIFDSDINLKFIHNNIQAKAAITTISRMFPRDLPVLSTSEMKKIASGMFPPEMDNDAVMRAFADVFGATEDIAPKVVAMRSYMVGVARHARQLASLVEGTKGTAKEMHIARLADVLDQLLDVQSLVSGTGTNVARALRAFGINVGPSKLRKGLAGIEDAKIRVDKAKAMVERAAKEGADTAPSDRILDDAVEALERLIKEETDSGLAGARAADEVGPEGLPKGTTPEPEDLPATKAEQPLPTREERIENLRKQADEILESEAQREARLREIEGLESPSAPDQARVSVRNMDPEELDALSRMIFLADEGDPVEMLQQILVPAMRDMARDGKRFIHKPELKGLRKAMRAAQWYRVNAMLSGPRTHAINTLSNMLTAGTRPLELFFGGAVRRDSATMREAGDLFAGMFMQYGDSWRAARKAMRLGEGVLDPKSSHFSQSYQATQDALRGGGGTLFQRVINTPGKLLMGLDEFASQINYRSHLRAGLLRQGRSRGLAGEALAEWTERHLRFGYGADGQGLIKKSIEFARENTFKAELGETGQAFEKLMSSNSVVADFLQVLMPFRKTPINITKYAWQRFPGMNVLSRDFRESLSRTGGKTVRDQEEALGKLVVGGMVYTSAAMLFANGSLTGDGPSEPRLRKAWLDAGHKPGTLTIGNTSIEIRRLDPVLTPLVMVGNLMEMAGELDDESYGEAAAMITLTLAQSVTERSFFSGLTEFFEATTQNDEARLTRWVENTIQSFIPNIAKQANPDPYYREAASFLEELRSRTIGISAGLEARRNLFGERVKKPMGLVQRAFNPLTMTFGSEDDAFARELFELGSSMVVPPEKKSFGEGGSVDLRQRGKWEATGDAGKNQSPYDRWMELTGSKQINGGRTLKARMERLAETQAWQKADPTQRRVLAEDLIGASQDAAWTVVLSEYPSLQKEILFRQTMGGMKAVTTDENTLNDLRESFGMSEQGRWSKLSEALRP
jgi:hypothetical protein